MRNVLTYCGLYTLGEPMRQAVAGIASELLGKLRRLNAVTAPVRHRGVFVIFDPEAVKRSLDELCADAGVAVFLHALVSEATRDDERIAAIGFRDHGGLHRLSAKAFVDASGDCDLAFFAGASTRYGNNGAVNLGTLGTRFGGIPRDVVVTSEQVHAAVGTARARGIGPLSKGRSVARLPISNDLCCYLVSEDYDPRDPASISAASRPPASLDLSRYFAQPAGLRTCLSGRNGSRFRHARVPPHQCGLSARLERHRRRQARDRFGRARRLGRGVA